MGMLPTDVDRQSLWQFAAAWNGHVAANTPDTGQLSERQAEDLFDWIDTGPAVEGPHVMPAFSWDGLQLLQVS